MSTDDITHLERVEQQLEFLSSTQPQRGRSHSIRLGDIESVEQKEGQR